MDTNPLMPGLFDAFPVIFGVVAFIVVAGIVAVIVLAIVNAGRVSARGRNPLTLQSDIAVAALDRLEEPSSASVADRLAALDALLAAGTITTEEHAAQRARILDSL